MLNRYKVHATKVGFRIYDYKKFDYIKDDDGNYFLTENKNEVTLKTSELNTQEKIEQQNKLDEVIAIKLAEEQKKLNDDLKNVDNPALDNPIGMLPRFCNPCLSGDTKVFIIRNQVEQQIDIKDVEVDDLVKSFNIKTNTIEYKKVLWSSKTRENAKIVRKV